MEGFGRGRRMNVDGRGGWREWRRERLMRWEDAGIRCEGEEEQDEKNNDQASRMRIRCNIQCELLIEHVEHISPGPSCAPFKISPRIGYRVLYMIVRLRAFGTQFVRPVVSPLQKKPKDKVPRAL